MTTPIHPLGCADCQRRRLFGSIGACVVQWLSLLDRLTTMAAAAPPADDGRSVYVGGMPRHAEWQELKDHMRRSVGGGAGGLSCFVWFVVGFCRVRVGNSTFGKHPFQGKATCAHNVARQKNL